MALRTFRNVGIQLLQQPRVWVASAAIAFVSSGVAAAGQGGPAQEPASTSAAATAAVSPTADPRYPVFTKVCRNCHDAERAVADRRSRIEWEEVLDRMAAKGAQASDDEWNVVLYYLLQNVGRVYVNRCGADELVEVLAISEKDAATIIAYRKDKGTFADFDALAKVPGVDVKTLEQHRDAIAF